MASDVSTRESGRYVYLGKYRVLAHIATGGMAAVYRALDPETGREVALKVLSPELVAGKPALVERFRREALHGAKLRHENIVALYEFGEAAGAHFLVLELVDGLNLQDHVENEGPLDPEEARALLIQVARALDHAHRQGLVHRDVKPANILLARQDGQTVAKLADLGLAREVRDEEFRITREGCTVGTVDYMAPEQARDSAAADIRSDIYSLGCTFFHMLAGVPPFHKGSLPERIYQHADAAPPDVREFNPLVPPDLIAVLRRMLAKKPADRYQTPAELLDGLLLTPQPPPQERRAPRPLAGRPRPRPSREMPTEAGTLGQRTACELSPAAQTGSARIAAGQFAWAKEQLSRGNDTYGVELLLTCCKLDPANLMYHRALRVAVKGTNGGGRRGWFGWLRGLASWIKFKLARRSRNHLQALARGEEVLARNPEDAATQIEMAAAATELGLEDLALWLLEEARREDKSSPEVNRALARYHEGHSDYERAMAYWERVARAAPEDREAMGKLRDLAALQTLDRHQQRQTAEQGDAPDALP